MFMSIVDTYDWLVADDVYNGKRLRHLAHPSSWSLVIVLNGKSVPPSQPKHFYARDCGCSRDWLMVDVLSTSSTSIHTTTMTFSNSTNYWFKLLCYCHFRWGSVRVSTRNDILGLEDSVWFALNQVWLNLDWSLAESALGSAVGTKEHSVEIKVGSNVGYKR